MTKIRIIKVPGNPNSEDLEKWRHRFENDEPSLQELINEGLVVEEIPISDNGMTLVKVGSESYRPSVEDLEEWRKVFEDAENDPDFKIFTHDAITVEHHRYQSTDLTVIVGNAVVIQK